jgi:hypothetical protein
VGIAAQDRPISRIDLQPLGSLGWRDIEQDDEHPPVRDRPRQRPLDALGHHAPAAHRKDRRRERGGEEGIACVRFGRAPARLAEPREDISNGNDLEPSKREVIQIMKGALKVRGEQPSDRRLAGAAQADQQEMRLRNSVERSRRLVALHGA